MLEINNVTYKVGSRKLLDNICTDIKSGQIVVIMGANGAGKTTLLKHISNEISGEGEVIFKGKNIKEWRYAEKSPHMAVFS